MMLCVFLGGLAAGTFLGIGIAVRIVERSQSQPTEALRRVLSRRDP